MFWPRRVLEMGLAGSYFPDSQVPLLKTLVNSRSFHLQKHKSGTSLLLTYF